MNRRNAYPRDGRQQSAPSCGVEPLVTNIRCAAEENSCFRSVLWTGTHLQMTLMCIPAGECVGLETHPELDQYLRIEQGCGVVKMGACCGKPELQRPVEEGCGIFVPAGTWHDLINTGCTPLKVSSVYAPPQHPAGTVHRTKAEAMAAEHH